MADAQTEPKLLLPFLRPFYDAAIPLSWLIVRVAVGWNLLVHGWGKIMAGPTQAFLKGYSDIGFNPPELWFWSRHCRRNDRRHCAHSRPVHPLLRRRGRDRVADHHDDLLENRLRLDAARLRIHADVGLDLLRHRAARRRAVFARPQARPGALIARGSVTPLCLAPVAAKYGAATLKPS